MMLSQKSKQGKSQSSATYDQYHTQQYPIHLGNRSLSFTSPEVQLT
jgi:hypothetical protein